MGVNYESQVYAMCDLCRANDACSRYTVTEYKTILRRKGWSIGRRTLCPKCAKLIKRPKNGGVNNG